MALKQETDRLKNMKAAVSATNVSKTYYVDNIHVQVLENLSFDVKEGEFVTITGTSGSGKTTLLNLIAGIDKPTNGSIKILDEDLGAKDEDALSIFRCNNIGFVFQSYNLISTLTIAENIAFPMEWLRKSPEFIDERVKELLTKVHLKNRAEHFPFQLSGGEQQRIAFARALANEPLLLLADEPTGNLDTETGLRIIEILREAKQNGKTLIVATHDEKILKLSDRKLRLDQTKLVG